MEPNISNTHNRPNGRAQLIVRRGGDLAPVTGTTSREVDEKTLAKLEAVGIKVKRWKGEREKTVSAARAAFFPDRATAASLTS